MFPSEVESAAEADNVFGVGHCAIVKAESLLFICGVIISKTHAQRMVTGKLF
jgi:hypothetical protein